MASSGHQGTHAHAGQSLNALAFAATVHCLTGCAIGEVLGMALGTALGWSNGATIVASILLAFVFGYGLTSVPLLRAGLPRPPRRPARARLRHALDHDDGDRRHADRALIPGALDAGLTDPLFWGSLAVALVLAGGAAYPVNRRLIARGKGHAVIHAYHHDSRQPAGA